MKIKKNIYIRLILYLGVLLIGCVLYLVAIGYLNNKREENSKVYTQKVTAEVYSFDTYHLDTRWSEKTKIKTTVVYKVDGKEYFGTIKKYESGMEIGDEIDIYIIPSNPEKLMLKEDKSNLFQNAGIVVIIVGLISIVTLILIHLDVRKNNIVFERKDLHRVMLHYRIFRLFR